MVCVIVYLVLIDVVTIMFSYLSTLLLKEQLHCQQKILVNVRSLFISETLLKKAKHKKTGNDNSGQRLKQESPFLFKAVRSSKHKK